MLSIVSQMHSLFSAELACSFAPRYYRCIKSMLGVPLRKPLYSVVSSCFAGWSYHNVLHRRPHGPFGRCFSTATRIRPPATFRGSFMAVGVPRVACQTSAILVYVFLGLPGSTKGSGWMNGASEQGTCCPWGWGGGKGGGGSPNKTLIRL